MCPRDGILSWGARSQSEISSLLSFMWPDDDLNLDGVDVIELDAPMQR